MLACGPSSGTKPDAGDGSGSGDALVDLDSGPDADTCMGGTLCGNPVMCCAAGNKCVDDRCLPACASGVRCGTTLDVCCNSGEVCLSNTCTVPGAACSDPYDCEPGNFCEPTLDKCLPQPDPLTCEYTPSFTNLSVTAEWSYTAEQVISIPVVANLDAMGAPEVVINVTHQDGGGYPDGRIAILNGNDGTVKVAPIAHNPPTSYGSHGRSTIAVGDVSGDGKPDIIYASRVNTGGSSIRSVIVAIDGNGGLLWISHTASVAAYGIAVENGGATLANFDGDAAAERVQQEVLAALVAQVEAKLLVNVVAHLLPVVYVEPLQRFVNLLQMVAVVIDVRAALAERRVHFHADDIAHFFRTERPFACVADKVNHSAAILSGDSQEVWAGDSGLNSC